MVYVGLLNIRLN